MVARKREPVILSKYSMNTLLHCELDTEQVPESIAQSLLLIHGPDTHPHYMHDLHTPDGVYSSARLSRYDVTAECNTWLQKVFPEIVNENCNIGIQHIKNLNEVPSAFIPHTDGPRRGKYLFSYLIDSGNNSSEATTYWWKEENQLLVRDPASIMAPAMAVAKYELLTEVSKTIIPTNRWVFLRANVLHSVHNIVSDRIALIIGTNNKEVANRILKNHTTDSKQIED